MKTTMKLFGIIALVAVIIFTLGSCVINVPDDNGGGDTPNTSINGTWEESGFIISISGTSGVIQRLPNFYYGGYTQSAIDKQYFKVGTQWFRNISKDNYLERTWSGQMILINHNGDNATGTSWSQTGTFTMDSNGKTFVFSSTASSGPYSRTYTRQ
jgi:hypothetical protein